MVYADGHAFDVGRQLGTAGYDAVREILMPTAAWGEITSLAHENTIARLAHNTRERFPAIWAEIEGLAAGLDLPVQSVFAWNCRGDLLSADSEGCTTVVMPGDPTVIAHNEDGMPNLNGHCFMADVKVASGSDFLAFCYPGSLPGHTFGVTSTGLYQAVNNLRLRTRELDIPRMVLGRAVLASSTLESAVDLLHLENKSGGFHFTLGQMSEPNPLSIEFGAGRCHVETIGSAFVHANHALNLFKGKNEQTITDSSLCRQQRAEKLVKKDTLNAREILLDQCEGELPILRNDPMDPDGENTLATAVIQIFEDKIKWNVYEQAGIEAVHTGSTELSGR
jgi:hypothetical protein